MSSEKIQLTLGDWQWNAAIVGFINIIGRENVRIKEDKAEFSSEVLEGFEEKYFAYLIRTYEKTLSWYRIVSFKDKLQAYEETDFEGFDLLALKSLNSYIKDVIKRYVKSNSYKAAYELMGLYIDLQSLEKRINTIKEPKTQQQFDVERNSILEDVRQACTTLKQIIDACDSISGKRYIRAKNVIYTVINNAWNGVSFLNPQTKEKDVYSDYKTYFLNPAKEYLISDRSKYKYQCSVCDSPIKDLNNDLSFIIDTGFDVARKTSHVWDFQNDIALCPVCKLVYSCLPAGITYAYDRGIYVNANINLQDALDINFKIKQEILLSTEGGMQSVYQSLVNALHEKENNVTKYELADVQVVRLENGSYRFNLLSRKMQEIIVEFETELSSLIKTAFNENGMSIQIYDEVITRILNSQNLFTLIHRMLYHKLSNPLKCYFNGTHVSHLLNINQRIYKSLGGTKMEKERIQENSSLVKNAKAAGYYLRKEYVNKGSDNKLPGICYRLLNALKTSNINMFMDVTLNCYLYVNSQVPKVIIDALGQDKSFSTMGYAFVAGLIDGYDNNESMGKTKEEVK